MYPHEKRIFMSFMRVESGRGRFLRDLSSQFPNHTPYLLLSKHLYPKQQQTGKSSLYSMA